MCPRIDQSGGLLRHPCFSAGPLGKASSPGERRETRQTFLPAYARLRALSFPVSAFHSLAQIV